jgi:acyl phosphate:glycerol-3-phosphate acyltransferase
MVARHKGIDITAVGSGNPGASNVARTMGARWGIAVFVLDGVKGTIPASVGLLLDARPGAYALAAAAVLGHMFPATRHLRGGKGVATSGGAFVVLQPVVFAILLAVWLLVRRITGKASLGSIAIALGLPVGVALAGSPGWEVAAGVGLAALVMLRHADNIERLMHGDELPAAASSPGSVDQDRERERQ